MEMRQAEFPYPLLLGRGDTLYVCFTDDGEELEIVDWRIAVDPVREAAVVAAFDQEMEELPMARGDEKDPRHTTEQPRGDEPLDPEERERFERERQAADAQQEGEDPDQRVRRSAGTEAGEPRKDD